MVWWRRFQQQGEGSSDGSESATPTAAPPKSADPNATIDVSPTQGATGVSRADLVSAVRELSNRKRRYMLGRTLGEGGMGEVRVAADGLLKRRVAFKRIRGNQEAPAEVLARFLDEATVTFDPRTACCVVMCSAGYPGPYEKGKVITGIEDAEALSGGGRDVIVFHAGTKLDADGAIVTNGGRVLGVTALAEDLQSARDLANAACEKIHFDGAFYRRDIGDRVLKGAGTVM